MARNKQIAIILADMLQFYGLDCLLKEYFSPLQISYFPNMQALAEKQPDWFDFYFTDAETFLIHGLRRNDDRTNRTSLACREYEQRS